MRTYNFGKLSWYVCAITGHKKKLCDKYKLIRAFTGLLYWVVCNFLRSTNLRIFERSKTQ